MRGCWRLLDNIDLNIKGTCHRRSFNAGENLIHVNRDERLIRRQKRHGLRVDVSKLRVAIFKQDVDE